jgi:hypothetical protein
MPQALPGYCLAHRLRGTDSLATAKAVPPPERLALCPASLFKFPQKILINLQRQRGRRFSRRYTRSALSYCLSGPCTEETVSLRDIAVNYVQLSGSEL